MVVTCPNCATKYRLDPTKIKGQRAKIRCPKCAESFVVHKTEDGSEAQVQAESSTAYAQSGGVDMVPQRPQQAQSTSNSGPSAGFDFAAALGGQAKAVRGAGPQQAKAKPGKPFEPDEDDPIGQRVVQFPVEAVAALPKGMSVETLDFPSVGIRGWKAKVAMGLVYAFDDLATLTRYVEEGKISPADPISYDSKHWRALEDLGDLANWFARVWLGAEKAKKEGAITLRKTSANPQDGAASSVAPAPQAPSTSSRATVETRTSSQARNARAMARGAVVSASRKGSKKSAPGPDWRPFHLLVALLSFVLVLLSVRFMLRGDPEGEAATPVPRGSFALDQMGADGSSSMVQNPQTRPTPEKLSERELAMEQALRKRMEEIAREAHRKQDLPEEMERMIPVRRRGSGRVQNAELLAAQSADDGERALRNGSVAEAMRLFESASRLDPSNGRYGYRYASAALLNGEHLAASRACERALNVDSTGAAACHRVLGDLARREGDTALATRHYASYLRVKPGAPDAKRVRAALEELGGARP